MGPLVTLRIAFMKDGDGFAISGAWAACSTYMADLSGLRAWRTGIVLTFSRFYSTISFASTTSSREETTESHSLLLLKMASIMPSSERIPTPMATTRSRLRWYRMFGVGGHAEHSALITWVNKYERVPSQSFITGLTATKTSCPTMFHP